MRQPSTSHNSEATVMPSFTLQAISSDADGKLEFVILSKSGMTIAKLGDQIGQYRLSWYSEENSRLYLKELTTGSVTSIGH